MTDRNPAPQPLPTAKGAVPAKPLAAGHAADAPATTRDDELLDEGLEETFPASDPVSAKHIT